MKWGLDFMGLVKLTTRHTGNQYILVVIDYTTKLVEAKAHFEITQVNILPNSCMKILLLNLAAPLTL